MGKQGLKIKRDSIWQFLSKKWRPSHYKLLEYAFRGYKISIKNVIRSMTLKEIEQYFNAIDVLVKTTEDALNDFEMEYLKWEGVYDEVESDRIRNLKKTVRESFDKLMKEVYE